jgi:hypothetical protein
MIFAHRDWAHDALSRRSEPPPGGDLSWSGVSAALPVRPICTTRGGKARQRRSGNQPQALIRPCGFLEHSAARCADSAAGNQTHYDQGGGR